MKRLILALIVLLAASAARAQLAAVTDHVSTPSASTPAGVKSYVCTVSAPSTQWTCNHNFGDLNVVVQVFDPNGSLVLPRGVKRLDPNNVQVNFANPTVGTVLVIRSDSVAIATNQPNAVAQSPASTQAVSGTSGQKAGNAYSSDRSVWAGPTTNKYATLSQALSDSFCSAATSSCMINLNSDFNESFSSTYTFGSRANQRAVVHGFPGANFVCNVTNGTPCFNLNNQSAIVGELPGGHFNGPSQFRGGFGIMAGPTAKVPCVICNINTDNNNSYIRLEDFFAGASTGANVTGAIVDLNNLRNQAILQNFFVQGGPNQGIRIHGAGPLNVVNVWAGGTGAGRSQPCSITSDKSIPTYAVQWTNGICNTPGPNQPMMKIDGGGGNAYGPTMAAIGINGLYMEDESAIGNASDGVLIKDAAAVHVRDSFLQSPHTDNVIHIQESASNWGNVSAISASNIWKANDNGTLGNLVLNDITGFSNQSVDLLYYGYGGRPGANIMPWTLDYANFQIVQGTNRIFSVPGNTSVDKSPVKYLFNANGSAVFRSHADNNQTMLDLDTGKTGVANTWMDFSDRGAAKWRIIKDNFNNFSIYDVVNGKIRLDFLSQNKEVASAPGCQLCLANSEHIGWRDAANGSDHTIGEIQKVTADIHTCATTGGTTPWTGAASCDVTWPSPFADTNYTPTCTAGAVSSGIPILQGISKVAANKVTVVIQQAGTSNAGFRSIFCTGIHN